MSSLKQIEANRLNAQHSIGPRSPRPGPRSQPEPLSNQPLGHELGSFRQSPPRPPTSGPASEASPELGSFRQFHPSHPPTPAPGPRPPAPATATAPYSTAKPRTSA